MLHNIWQSRELLWTLVRRDLIVRYQSSVLGIFWAFAKPLALVAIFHLAFRIIMRIPLPNENVYFSMHLLVGILVWSFLARAISEGHWAILSHANLIKKIKLSAEIFPATIVVGNLINFALGMLIVFPIILMLQPADSGFMISHLLFQVIGFVGLTALLALLVLALTLLASATNVFYRDMEALSEVALTAWFYATPIVYPVSLVHKVFADHPEYPSWLEHLYWLNPIAPIAVAYRRIFLYTSKPLEVNDARLAIYLAVSVVTIVITYLIAQKIFRHYSRFFADEV